MKKLALISSYCDTENKKSVLDENLSKLKKLGVDTFVISPIHINIDSDYYFFTKENPVLGPEYKAISFWKNVPHYGKTLRMMEHVSDYGWASLYQIKKLMQIAKDLDYDLFYILIYDLIITNDIELEITSDKKNAIYPRRDSLNYDVIYPCSLHFAIFDKTNLESFSNKISFEDYVHNNGFAENFIETWSKQLPLLPQKIVVTDSIVNHPNPHKFNISKSDDYKLFISKNPPIEIWKGDPPYPELLASELKIFIYDVRTPTEVNIKINNNSYDFYIEKDKLLDFAFDSLKLDNIEIEMYGENQVYTDEHKKIVRNFLYYED